MATITSVETIDLRFPTSLDASGSDAMNPDADYSASYVVIHTDGTDARGHQLTGYGLTFTIGRGNDIVCAAAQEYGNRLVGCDVDQMAADMGGIYLHLASDSQMRWLGPEKGVVHLALSAVMNAVWDLAGRLAGKPVWRLLAEMTPEQLVDIADLRYLADVLPRERALEILQQAEAGKAERIADLEAAGYPAYTTAAGWLGYSDEKMLRIIAEQEQLGFTAVKLKVGANLDDDIRRCTKAREAIGAHRPLMIDANQIWDVPTAIRWVNALKQFDLKWIEEPTSPDDVLGHRKVRDAVAPIGVATGEHCHNRVMFKQFLEAGAMDYCQIDAGRLASVNEILAVLLLAAHFEVPVCPHAGGVGLCEMVHHMSMLDYVAVSGSYEGRLTEYVDSLHEYFVHPVKVANGRYQVTGDPGYNTEMTQAAIDEFSFPDGSYWASVR
ncbi:enolase C-terminal domain-like protein [Propionimicrobium sp. PCR01-08-3]|uniref:enolase C-terminal domain-like protein n=1 Tax=Propionimicrobium sp. PCR01-08-3 TaxID=3052086 RepID=UPI00255CEDAE|nr:enolase C-terminal domain-like protein [Propionimicrobium sp. PCR01-08-3]WIY83864.1 enolase C-terminal domain-like protein [Propionimicrobium sp. PCR01-08-3]